MEIQHFLFEAALFMVIAAPLFVALGLTYKPLTRLAITAAPWTALPVLALSLVMPTSTSMDMEWLLLNMQLGFDQTSKVFLFFTSFLWLFAGFYAQHFVTGERTRHRFFIFYLLAMSGNFGVTVAHDIVSFLFFFALMGLASYGLIVHRRNVESLYAARVYISLVIIGEMCLFAGAVLAASASASLHFTDISRAILSSPLPHTMIALFVAGFGIKAGMVPLHIWLPLAHPAAPTPASAVLSGAMIKAGLLGWMRFLPLGVVALPFWSQWFIFAGLTAAFFGVLAGLTQSNPKTILAYSSISQMGFMTILIGAGLATPHIWEFTLTAVLIYALHHGLAKGALFLSGGISVEKLSQKWQVYLVSIGLVFPALTLSGAPWTSGAVAKRVLKDVLYQDPLLSPEWLMWAISLGAVATSLLMARFLWLVWPRLEHQTTLRAGLWVPWTAVLIASATTPWVLPWPSLQYVARESLRLSGQWSNLWPLLLAAALVAFVIRYARSRAQRSIDRIPAGDFVVLMTAVVKFAFYSTRRTVIEINTSRDAFIVYTTTLWQRHSKHPIAGLTRVEAILGRWQTGGVLLLILGVGFFVSLVF